MIGKSLSAGLTGIRRRPGLVLLLFGTNLALAFVLSVPVYIMLGSAVGATGFSEELARGFDIVLWFDLIEEMGDVLQALQFQLLWMIPLYLVWKAAASAGLIHALRGDAVRSFWEGVGRYTGRAVLLGLAFLVSAVLGIIGVVMVALVLATAWPGEVGAFWINFVLAPTLLISVLAVLDLMHDYARMAIVIDEKKVMAAALTGLAWPFRHGQASRLYLVWFVPAALLLVLPTVFDMNAAAATGGAIWGLFLVQQGLLLARAAVTVGWFGSETALYEAVRLREMPLIAAAEDAAASATDGATFPGDILRGAAPDGRPSA